MLKVYFLQQLKDIAANTEYTEGWEFISHAISEATEKPDVRRVIIEENADLDALALRTEAPSQRDLDNYASLPEPTPPPRNLEAELDSLAKRLKLVEDKVKGV